MRKEMQRVPWEPGTFSPFPAGTFSPLGIGSGTTVTNISPTELAARVVDLNALIRERGLLNALEEYATSIFREEAVTSLYQAGGFTSLKHETIVFNGVEATKTTLLNGDSYVTSLDDQRFLARDTGTMHEEGTFAQDPVTNRTILVSGFRTIKTADGNQLTQLVQQGFVAQEFRSEPIRTVAVTGLPDRPLNFAEDFRLRDGRFEDLVTGESLFVDNGAVTRRTLDQSLRLVTTTDQPNFLHFSFVDFPRVESALSFDALGVPSFRDQVVLTQNDLDLLAFNDGASLTDFLHTLDLSTFSTSGIDTFRGIDISLNSTGGSGEFSLTGAFNRDRSDPSYELEASSNGTLDRPSLIQRVFSTLDFKKVGESLASAFKENVLDKLVALIGNGLDRLFLPEMAEAMTIPGSGPTTGPIVFRQPGAGAGVRTIADADQRKRGFVLIHFATIETIRTKILPSMLIGNSELGPDLKVFATDRIDVGTPSIRLPLLGIPLGGNPGDTPFRITFFLQLFDKVGDTKFASPSRGTAFLLFRADGLQPSNVQFVQLQSLVWSPDLLDAVEQLKKEVAPFGGTTGRIEYIFQPPVAPIPLAGRFIQWYENDDGPMGELYRLYANLDIILATMGP